ncbi:MAG: DNA recombination protein RmuC [Patescibacteria group bacterium]|jgi:DNA recombination protein RmuC
MTSSIIIAFIIIAAIVGGFLMLDRRLRTLTASREDDKSFLLLNQNMQGVQTRMDETTRSLNSRLDRAAEVIQEVSQELGHMKEIGRSMRDLQDFLKSPKLRGNIGEQVMRDLLEQYFPRAHFDLQYTFATGDRVDAVLKTDKGLISIDAKFPLENFQRMQRAENDAAAAVALHDFIRDTKKHITDISKKYILPAEGTADFAIMYVPSESIYYEIIRQDEELNGYANEKRVFLVSPNSFYYFLKVVMIGLEGKRVEENARRILETMRAIQKDASRFGGELEVMSKHITNAKNAVDRVNTEYARLSGRIDDIRLLN